MPKLAYAKDGSTFPSLDDPFRPTALDQNAALVEARRLVVAAAAQLIATVRSPVETLQEYAPGMYNTATLGFVEETNVADIVKEGGPQGLHVKDISARNGVDQSYLARVLRYLSTRHIFREVSPNVFANNRISSLLVKAKSVKEIQAEYVLEGALVYGLCSNAYAAPSPNTMALHLRLLLRPPLKTVHLFSSYLQNPAVAAAPFNVAFKTDAKMWDWYEEPGNEWRARRFTASMKGGGDRFPPQIFTSGINGDLLKPGDVVVDVGGSIGSVALTLYKTFPKLHYVVQDLGKQIDEAKKIYGVVHDFFTPQPVKNAAVYFLRVVVHDWPDHDAKRILSNLRDAAGPSSKLILFDTLALYSCEDPSSTVSVRKVPSPLLANLGVAGAGFATGLDLQMLTLFNGKERTEDEFRELGNATGWKLESVKPGPLATMVFSVV
ncbi:hypothetical protein DXG01_011699 [Tephrocybe rancida]|nr:hypothetical protein DXG01_011699 [Tephrocybe rancida]